MKNLLFIILYFFLAIMIGRDYLNNKKIEKLTEQITILSKHKK